MPTRFGNALRALERFGFERYGLGSVTLWLELVAVSPEPIRASLEESRAVTDFFVRAIANSALVALAALATALGRGLDRGLLVTAAVALAVAVTSYRRATTSTLWYRRSVQALVHLGRRALAREYGLVVPSALRDERRMWLALTAFVQGKEAWVPELDKYRVSADSQRCEALGTTESESPTDTIPS